MLINPGEIMMYGRRQSTASAATSFPELSKEPEGKLKQNLRASLYLKDQKYEFDYLGLNARAHRPLFVI